MIIGALGARIVGSLTSRLLFEVQPNDPLVFLAGAAALAAVALGASHVPARRALRISPVVALNTE